MKIKKLKKALVVLGAGIMAAGVLAACSDNKGEDATADSGLEEIDSTSVAGGDASPVAANTDVPETEKSIEGQTESAAADVYGDGADQATAKQAENGLAALRDHLKGSAGAVCGFAYLGTVPEGASVKDVIDASETAKNFSFIKDMDASKTISDGGNDLFVFVPSDGNSRVTVNTFAESDSGKTIYSSEKGAPIFVRTLDELNDSMEIVITDSAGNTATFTPDITTGSIVDAVYKDLIAYNFSADVRESKGLNKQYLLDTVLFRVPELSDMMANGTSLSADSYNRIYIDDLEFYTLDFGHNEGGRFVKDFYFAVSKDGTLVYRYDTEAGDWGDTLAFDFNSEQYR